MAKTFTLILALALCELHHQKFIYPVITIRDGHFVQFKESDFFSLC